MFTLVYISFVSLSSRLVGWRDAARQVVSGSLHDRCQDPSQLSNCTSAFRDLYTGLRSILRCMKHISGCPIIPFRIAYRAWHIQNFQVFGIEDCQAEADDLGGCRLGCLESLEERDAGRMLKRFERAVRNGIWREPITTTWSTKVQSTYLQAWSSLPVANKKGSHSI